MEHATHWVMCSFLLETGAPSCHPPRPLNEALAMMVAANQTFPFDPKTSKRTPYTLYPADQAPT